LTFPISPGVYNVEQDLSVTVPVLGSTTGAIAGIFTWGPLFQPFPVTSQSLLAQFFGPPTASNYETWFSAFNFLEYGNQLMVVRTANTTSGTANCALNAVVGTGFSNADILNSVILNKTTQLHQAQTGGWPSTVNYVAKWPSGFLGNSLAVGQCSSPAQYHSNIALSGTITSGLSQGNSYTGSLTLNSGANSGTLTFIAAGGSSVAAGNTFANTLINSFSVGDYWKVATGIRGNPSQFLQTTAFSNAITNSTSTIMTVNFAQAYNSGGNLQISTVERFWEFYKQVTPPTSWTSAYQAASTNPNVADLVQVIVVDNAGNISGVPNTVLEIYENVSRSIDALNPDGTTNYYRNVINTQSPWIWNVNDLPGALSANSGQLVAVTNGSVPFDQVFSGGQDGDSESSAPQGTLINGWILFQGVEAITIDLVIAGKPLGQSAQAGELGTTYNNFGMASWLISNIVGVRRDCLLCFSPDSATVINNTGNESTDLVNWASLLPSSTYATMDSGYKLQLDPFNNVNRWVPLNGDIAGLCVFTDKISYPWMSPAGFNRGQISNVIQLAYNPQEADRDIIYPQAINPVVTFPGQGTFLYGDKTFTTEPTGFSRINVRRLFLVIERAIKAAAQFTLFELNDVFTQNQFKNLVTPYLSNIQGAGGIINFLVVCDSSVNTPTVVDANEFLCSIYIQPAKSINFIQITYINTPTGISFSTLEPTQ
jgi:Phage tail sheath C-terminal domain/Phage tail sheath protein subtilisin-like domain